MMGCVHPGLVHSDVDSQPPQEDHAEVAAAASTWRPGSPVPEALLSYRPREGCISAQYETASLYASVDNVPLLVEVIGRGNAAEPTVQYALERALVLEGPNKIYDRLTEVDVPSFVHQRMVEPNVWVSASVGIDEADKRSGVAKEILLDLMGRVADGEDFEDAYRALFRKHATLTNLGDFVLSPSHRSARPLRDIEVPEEHVERLLAAEAGELVMMKQATPHHGNRFVVYQVEEIYRPDR